MDNISWRHHYIPQFYLQGFTNEQGLFKIYDVESSRFIKDGKWFSPESYFFERDGNAILIHNEKDDFLEKKYYKDIDQKIAELFNKIRLAKPGTNFGITDDDMPLFQYFVGILFWRLPQNYSRLNYLLKNTDLTKIGFSIKNQSGEIINNSEKGREIIQSPNVFKAMKFLLPNLLFPEILKCETPLHIHEMPKGLPSLCSDNPIIFEDSVLPNIYSDNFILPVTNRILFIRSNKINPNCETNIKIDIDLILLKQSKKYVSCTDELYIHMLNKYFECNYNSIEEVKKKVFSEIIG